jgi:hypothetical protein
MATVVRPRLMPWRRRCFCAGALHSWRESVRQSDRVSAKPMSPAPGEVAEEVALRVSAQRAQAAGGWPATPQRALMLGAAG